MFITKIFLFFCVCDCIYDILYLHHKQIQIPINQPEPQYPVHSDLRRAIRFDVCAFFLPALRLIALRFPSGAFRVLTL